MKEITQDEDSGGLPMLHQLSQAFEGFQAVSLGNGNSPQAEIGAFPEVQISHQEGIGGRPPDSPFRQKRKGMASLFNDWIHGLSRRIASQRFEAGEHALNPLQAGFRR